MTVNLDSSTTVKRILFKPQVWSIDYHEQSDTGGLIGDAGVLTGRLTVEPMIELRGDKQFHIVLDDKQVTFQTTQLKEPSGGLSQVSFDIVISPLPKYPDQTVQSVLVMTDTGVSHDTGYGFIDLPYPPGSARLIRLEVDLEAANEKKTMQFVPDRIQ